MSPAVAIRSTGLVVVGAGLFALASRYAGELPRQAAPVAVSADPDEPFPRTVVDDQGFILTLPEPPTRIVSNTLVTDHYLAGVVPHERIVGVSAFGGDPQYSHVAAEIQRLDAIVASDVERVLRQKPDLVLTSNISRSDFVDLLRAAGVPTFRLHTTVDEFSEIAEGIRTIGYLTGEDAAAAAEIDRMTARIVAAKARAVRGGKPVRVLAYSKSGYTQGVGSLFHSIVSELGAVDLAGEQGVGSFGKIGSEQVAAWNPDWIVAGADPGTHGAMLAQLRGDPGVQVTTAGKKDQLLVIDTRDYLSTWQQSVVLMEKLAEALYPGTT